MKNILVYHAGALGDFVAILPTLGIVREQMPHARVTLLGRPAFGRLARSRGLVDAVWDCGGSEIASLFSERPRQETVRKLRRFDAALMFIAHGSPLLRTTQKNIPHVRWQPPFPENRTPVVAYHASLALHERADRMRALSRLRQLPPLRRGAVNVVRTKEVFLHPGSGSERKNWPFDKMVALARKIEFLGYQPAWLLGPAESGLQIPAQTQVIREPDLSVLCDRLTEATACIGNDSGVAHLAAMTGCTTITLFGPSDPLVWSPFGPRAYRIDASPPCRPCHPASEPKTCETRCMDTITVTQVVETFQRVVRDANQVVGRPLAAL